MTEGEGCNPPLFRAWNTPHAYGALMAEFEFNSEKHIVIANKIYMREDMSDEIKAAISHVNFADQELATKEQNLRIYRYGRDALVRTLIERIDAEKLAVVAVLPDPEAEPPQAEPVAVAAR